MLILGIILILLALLVISSKLLLILGIILAVVGLLGNGYAYSRPAGPRRRFWY
jgi:hypothetical protein